MRTTLVIDDELLRRAKRRAAETDATLSDVVNDALRTTLARERFKAAPFEFVTFGRSGKRVRHEPKDFADSLEVEDRARLRQ